MTFSSFLLTFYFCSSVDNLLPLAVCLMNKYQHQ